MYADDILLFSETVECLPNRLNCMYEYCGKWNLSVNKQQTKFVLFRKGSILRRNTQFQYGKNNLEIVNQFAYLGIIFTTGGALHQA